MHPSQFTSAPNVFGVGFNAVLSVTVCDESRLSLFWHVTMVGAACKIQSLGPVDLLSSDRVSLDIHTHTQRFINITVPERFSSSFYKERICPTFLPPISVKTKSLPA